MPGHDIFVIGTSAGGVETLMQLCELLPENLNAAVFVVLHLPKESISNLPRILSRSGPLAEVNPQNSEPIQKGKMYVAPPDYHLIVKRGKIMLSHGPQENGHRPAIDALFRSAAGAYGPRVAGVLLTGIAAPCYS